LDRTAEHLGVSDEGVILLRRLFKDCIESVAKGQDPLGVIRDAAKNEMIRLVPGEYKVNPAEF
jgi:5,5'-dehydrodivanillate O-demethylase